MLLPPSAVVWTLHLCSVAYGYALYNDTAPSAPSSTTSEQQPGNTAAAASYTGLPAYDPTVLIPPTPPQPATTGVAINIPLDPVAAGLRLSKTQKGNFLGFSIELSVASSVMGRTPRTIKPTFLNYMANIRNRAGAGPIIRVGGNSQESSTLFTDGSGGDTVDKLKVGDNPTSTPQINYTPELLYLMANVSALVNAEWYFGLSFNQSAVESRSPNVALAASHAQQILGPNLRGLAMGNEPDLYVDHWVRPQGWTVNNYVSEFETMRNDVVRNAPLANQAALVGPSVCCLKDGFQLEDVLNTGWLDQNIDYLAAVTVQHYPNNNCQIGGNVRDSQTIFPDFLNHTSAQALTSIYLDGSAKAMAAGKEMVMLEFNSASCGGFPGLSDSFGAALWLTDWALQLAWGNFSSALMHVGGQNVYYNPFTPPDYTRSKLGWTTGSIYYSTLIIAEAFGSSNTSQVVDLLPSPANMYHPAYMVYESGRPVRAVLFNYLSDPSGGSDYTAAITLTGTEQPDHVNVRYFSAPSVSEQYNITWAGQTLGGSFESDGTMRGEVSTLYIPCSNRVCYVHVPAPSIALVFLTDPAMEEATPTSSAQAFATTVIDVDGLAVDPAALLYGNGMNPDWKLVYSSATRLSASIGAVVVATAAFFF